MTHASKALDARPSSAWNSRAWPIACGLLVFAELMAQVFKAARQGPLLLEDDAYYYTVIARNIVRTGASSFDGISLTNGYHPLWMIVLVAKDLVFGDSVFAVLTLEAVLTAAAVWLFLDRGNCRQPWFCLPFVWLYMRIVPAMVLSGMEVSLLLFCVGLFVAALDRAGDDTAVGAAFLGGAAALVVGARIDSAFFVAPALLAAPISRRSRGLAFGVLGAAAGVYAIYDLAMFGMVLPVSSAVKSLGGMQWNGRLVAQMSAQWTLFHLRSVLVVTLLGLIVSPVLLVFSCPGTRGRVLATASTVGGVLYAAKLLFDSSWCIWAWYGFAVIFPVLAAFYVAVPAATAWWDGRGARRLGPAWSRGVVAVLTVGLALVVGRQSLKLSSRPQLREVSYWAVNRLAVARYGGLLGGAPIAMGDRAGSFADAYHGPVVQLEGLTNDLAYLRAVRRGGDVTALLCARRVKFLADYEVDLGRYDVHRIDLLRPVLTQFHGPTATVWARDEVGRVIDARLFDAAEFHLSEHDNTLYIWRLACPAGARRGGAAV